ncbi:unnamed protein product [Phytomonas sp. Hart1]|nr:unnamed protein product [Phytomonas sp. Hart1]|eukprot:CCW68630.1 unnamed protein product [Phytomonas sp. isolate Hart1]
MSVTLAEPKTSVVSGGRKKITSKFTDGSELVEEYDVISDDLMLRKRRIRNVLGGWNDWIIEIGAEERLRNLDQSLIVESIGNPQLVRQDTEKFHVFRIRNLTYPKDTFMVEVEKNNKDPIGEIVVQTTNKKYYKRISIPEMVRAELPLDPSHLSFDVKHNTLIINYKKHVSILQIESQAKKERTSLPSKRVEENNANCAQQ